MQNFQNINIQGFLPHREPMLMADHILEIDEENVITNFEIKEDNIFVENAFLNEAGLTEHIAQTCSSILGQAFFAGESRNSKKVIGFITNIKSLKIFELPKIGNNIISKASKISQFGSICNMNCQTFCGEHILAEAEICMFITEV